MLTLKNGSSANLNLSSACTEERYIHLLVPVLALRTVHPLVLVLAQNLSVCLMFPVLALWNGHYLTNPVLALKNGHCSFVQTF